MFRTGEDFEDCNTLSFKSFQNRCFALVHISRTTTRLIEKTYEVWRFALVLISRTATQCTESDVGSAVSHWHKFRGLQHNRLKNGKRSGFRTGTNLEDCNTRSQLDYIFASFVLVHISRTATLIAMSLVDANRFALVLI